ncbi:hypothetical protein [Polyangium aurulentum]|uniref:hypothetical protein n=1 Tax=Polyangium aurulentum TaxID=2567896 RepID=UPI0010AEC7EC|nr:hypothetical protein [Polyangium aurulentum]UQA56379.1 hypothetical protein E8A73_034435 [Polyangium aurulentum]
MKTYLGIVGLCLVLGACSDEAPSAGGGGGGGEGGGWGGPASGSGGGAQMDAGVDAATPDEDAGADAGPEPMPMPLTCTPGLNSFNGIDRGTSKGVERVLAIADHAGDLVGVVTDKAEVFLLRWPAAGGDAQKTSIATPAGTPYWPSIVVLNGVIHVTWIDGGSWQLQHSALEGGVWTTSTVASDALTGALVRGALGPEIAWIGKDGSLHLSQRTGDMWTDTPTNIYLSSGSGPMDAVVDANDHRHIVQASSTTNVLYASDVGGVWQDIDVEYSMQGAKEASVAVTPSGEVYVAYSTQGYAGWTQRMGDSFTKAKPLDESFVSAQGAALTMHGSTPWAATATKSGGIGLITTPVRIGPLSGGGPVQVVDSTAYAFTPALHWVGDTLHVVWGYASGVGGSLVFHKACQ